MSAIYRPVVKFVRGAIIPAPDSIFRGQGFDVVLCARLTPGRSFTEVDPAEVYEWVRTKTPPQADAVFIGGNGLRTVGAIHALETVLRRPVLTANQVAFWAALRVGNMNAKVVDYGRIFATG
jgi:maleate isomerase